MKSHLLAFYIIVYQFECYKHQAGRDMPYIDDELDDEFQKENEISIVKTRLFIRVIELI